ncbi:hypothetical protein WN943_023151 [Citrus x changshan-huyou]
MTITGSMKAAYCAVVVNCSVRFLGIQKEYVQPKCKHIVSHRCTRGEIIDIKGLSSYEPCSEYDILPTPEVDKVQETFKSSSLELLAIIMDPLPDVLLWAEVVVSDMARKN